MPTVLVLSPFLFWGHICVSYMVIMPNFNDVYLHNYQVLDYGLICKNNPKWGLVSVVLGLDAHLSHLSCRFTCHPDMFIKYGALGSFCVESCCVVLDLHQCPPSLSLLLPVMSLVLSLYAMPKVDQKNKVGGKRHRACAAEGWGDGGAVSRGEHVAAPLYPQPTIVCTCRPDHDGMHVDIALSRPVNGPSCSTGHGAAGVAQHQGMAWGRQGGHQQRSQGQQG